MRNVFHQYSQSENRITHALMTALDEDRTLLRHFLRDLLGCRTIDARSALVLEQTYPGAPEFDEEEAERRGIPDGWICASGDDPPCVVIESKVTAPLSADQIKRHRRIAERCGFKSVRTVVIAPDVPNTFPADVRIEWRTVYSFLKRHTVSGSWAMRAAEYLEISEAQLIAAEKLMQGTLTRFSGFPFGTDRPFTYLEGKRLLRLSLDQLRSRSDLKAKLGMNPDGLGRKAITGKQGDAVWDFLSVSKASDDENFTHQPHLTLSITRTGIEAFVTLPHGLNTRLRQRLKSLGEGEFHALVAQILKNMKPLLRAKGGSVPWMRGVQRRYPTQRSKPFLDARIDFDLRTAVSASGPPKAQPLWLSAAYGAFTNKQGSNYQLQIGMIFPYEHCPELRKESATDLIARAWIACKPLLELN